MGSVLFATVPAEGDAKLIFPDAFSAHWIRLTPLVNRKATATFFFTWCVWRDGPRRIIHGWFPDAGSSPSSRRAAKLGNACSPPISIRRCC
jgi:hypothetical protein